MDIQPNEQKRIDKAGFKVTMAGSSYVVRHPSMRRKHEGGNLSAILTSAERDLEELEEKKAKTTAKKTSTGYIEGSAQKQTAQKANGKANTKVKAAAEQPKPEEDKPEPKPPRAAKTKRSQGDWKTYQIGKLILRNPAKTPEEILALCKEQQIDTKIMTIVGLHRYFRLCVKVLADIAAEDQKAS